MRVSRLACKMSNFRLVATATWTQFLNSVNYIYITLVLRPIYGDYKLNELFNDMRSWKLKWKLKDYNKI